MRIESGSITTFFLFDVADETYRFAVDQTQMSRANLLELTIVFILVLELALVFMGLLK